MKTKRTGFFVTIESVTLRDIADWCEVDIKTVRRWVDKMSRGDGQDVQGISDIKLRCYEAGENGEAVQLSMVEALQVISEGKGEHFASIIKENYFSHIKAQEPAKPRAARLPAGAQMTALERIYGAMEARKRIDFAMGYTNEDPASSQVLMIESVPVAQNLGRLSPQAYAVEMKNREKAAAKDEQARLTPELFRDEVDVSKLSSAINDRVKGWEARS